MKRIMCVLLALMALVLGACSQQQPAKEVDLGKVMSDLSAAYGLEEGMLELTKDDLLELYGIEAEDVKQFAARLQMESTLADEIILIESVDSKAAERVKEMLENRYQSKLNETRDYLPDEFAKIEKCKVAQNGNFVSMIVCAEAEKAVNDYEKAIQ